MNKQEIENKIEALEKQLEELKKKVNSPEGIKRDVRRQPILGQYYFYLDDSGVIRSIEWHYDDEDLFHFNTGNCFKTEQEAEEYKENLLTKQALKDLALELNNGVEICWENYEQSKFSIYYNGYHFANELKLDSADCYTEIGQVYCLNTDFLSIAKDRIGEEKLIKLIKSGV